MSMQWEAQQQNEEAQRFEEESWHERAEWERWHREMTELLDNDPGYHAWLDDLNRVERTESEEYGGDGRDAVLEG